MVVLYGFFRYADHFSYLGPVGDINCRSVVSDGDFVILPRVLIYPGLRSVIVDSDDVVPGGRRDLKGIRG